MTYFMTPIACIINCINISLAGGNPSTATEEEEEKKVVNPALVNYCPRRSGRNSI